MLRTFVLQFPKVEKCEIFEASPQISHIIHLFPAPVGRATSRPGHFVVCKVWVGSDRS